MEKKKKKRKIAPMGSPFLCI